MKPATLLLLASLLANGALVAILVTRPGSPAQPLPAVSSAATKNARLAARADANTLLAALEAGDARALVAAGVPSETASHLTLGRAIAHYADALRAGRTNDGSDPRWWKSGNPRTGMSREQRQQVWAAQRELSDALTAALGDDLGLFGGRSSDAHHSFLPPGKRDALRRIEQDYVEMMAEHGTPGSVQLASDREKLRLLRAERERDIASLLSPSELAEYELRASATAANVRARYGDAITSEEDFRAIYALQKAFDEKFPREALMGRVTPEVMQQRSAAERQLQDDLRRTLGEEKYAALRRASDSDVRAVDSLVSRLNLPAGTTDAVIAARENYAAESQRINSDASLPPAQRRASIQALGTQAKAQVTQALGSEAGEAYAQRSSWLAMLQSGMAYSTNPKDAPPGAMSLGSQSVFPIIPAGAAAGGRQVMHFVDGSGAAPAGPNFVLPAPGAVQTESTRMISVMRTDGPGPETAPAHPPAPPPANSTRPPNP